MNTGKFFIFNALVYIILLMFIYFSKRRYKSKENKIYSILIITSFIGVLLELGCRLTIPLLNEIPKTLQGKTFVVTGSVNHYKNRDELKADIVAHGGTVTGSVSSKTSYLINNDINSTSSKNQKAKSLNIPIITECQYLQLIGE